ncbi:hypothetical protein N0V93_006749 [Gnomoniopsis smithogilvyi]|uniref:Thioesterase domain-containing protein n=1 Tax=Gnomoniopsis smithogilvyi TaxID=1191159 RepID=A0A9W9CV04_9PEZI|nr:hypothetical protein N0V93_006749 [Gnomoniopsis smithogilvyi]
MAEDDNPGLIYEAEDGPDPLNVSHIPLVLIHDGGGTCFSYYCLDPIGRPIYEIHNPRYYTQQPWEGGIPEIARYYVSLIHKTVPCGRIILGGWSFGGILSLEMARVLADDPLYDVIGIVMVDSICPGSVKADNWKRGVIYEGQFSERTSQETIDRVTWCFSDAVRVIEEYQMPSWDNDDQGEPGSGLRNSALNGDGKRSSNKESTKATICPPAILLRATDWVPVDSDVPSRVDLVRHDRSLGWNGYRKGFFEEIVDMPGHHFSIFAFENTEKITESLQEACSKLERLSNANN